MLAVLKTGILSLCVCVPIFIIRKLKWVPSSTSRKLLHIAMAPVYMLCWPFFESTENAKWMAAMIPIAFTVLFWAIGSGLVRIPLIADSMSRSGRADELSGGPVHYGFCISLASVLFWKRVEAFYCILPISFGDGFAAFFGPSISHNQPLWWNPSKSWFGFIAFILCSYLGLILYIAIFTANGWLLNADPMYLRNAFIVSILCAFTESLTIPSYDNITIFVVGILSYFYLQ